MGTKILIVGSGGREHALALSFAESAEVDAIICCPGNAGTAQISKCRNESVMDNAGIVDLAERESIDLVVPGPEAPLAEGLIDMLSSARIRGFGPPAASARLESSKGFAKDFMTRNRVATADYRRFTDPDAALAAVDSFGFPVVVKADGLAAGKGVLICENHDEAAAAVESVMLRKDFGDAGAEIVLEECLVGWETSIIGIVDTDRFFSFLPAKDHKRAGDGDVGLNTGGMGVIAPHPLVTEDVARDIKRNIIDPTMAGLRAEGLSYSGFLFIGVMVTDDGAKTLEYNVRFGDPEAQALLPLLSGGLYGYVMASLDGRLNHVEARWRGGASCCLVMASEGYPGSYEKGNVISGITDAEIDGCRVYLAGVREGEAGKLFSSGGRVLGVTGLGTDLENARRTAYRGIRKIHFNGGWYRGDIGGVPVED